MRRIKIPFGIIVFVAIWLLALCVPTTREMGRSLAFFVDWQGGGMVVNNQGKVAAELARELPDNPVAAGWAAQIAFYPAKDNGALLKAQQRFPRDIELRALRLRQSAALFGDIAAARKSKNAAHLKEWSEAAQVARAGGQIEPDNAFWPWMETAFELVGGKEDAAMRAFARIAGCQRFDDYQSQTTNSRLQLWKQRRKLAWEDKLDVAYSVVFSHNSALRGAANFASTRAVSSKKSGDVQGALALEGAVLQGARLWRRDSDPLISALSAERIARESLEKFLEIPKPAEPGQTANGSWIYVDPAIHGGALARAWASYARANGRADLADEADYVADASVSREMVRYFENEMWAQFGMPAPLGNIAAIGPMLLALLSSAIFGAALLWSFALPARWRGDEPSRGQAVACANFSFWLLLGLCALFVTRNDMLLNSWLNFDNGKTVTSLLFCGFVIIATLCWLLPLWFLGWKRQRQWVPVAARNRPVSFVESPWKWRAGVWSVAASGALLVGCNTLGVWNDATFDFPYATWILIAGLIGALALEIARWRMSGPRRIFRRTSEKIVPPRRLAWARASLWALTFVGLSIFVRGAFSDSLAFDQILIGLFSALALCGAIAVGCIIARDHFVWQLAHRALGVLLVMWSVAFLLFSLGLVPLRAQLNRNLDRQIQIGEIAWMREQIAKTK